MSDYEKEVCFWLLLRSVSRDEMPDGMDMDDALERLDFLAQTEDTVAAFGDFLDSLGGVYDWDEHNFAGIS